MPNKDISDSLFRTIVDIYKEKSSGVRPNYQDSSVPLDLNDYIFVHSGCVNPTYSEPHGKKIVSFYKELASKFPNEHKWLSLDELKYFLRMKGISLDSIFRWREDPDYEFESESEEEEWNDYNNQLASKDDLFAIDIDNDFDGFLLGLCFFLDFNDLTLEDLNNILCEKHWFINNDKIWEKQLVIYLKFDDVVFYTKNKIEQQSTVEDKSAKSDLKKDNMKLSEVKNTNKPQTLLEQVLAYDLNKENHTLVSRAIQIVNDHKLSDIDITENAYISAECEGSHGESYFVYIKLDKKDRMIATCECPFFEDGKSVSDPTKSIKCKHILALIYYVQDNKEEIYEQIEKELAEAEEKYGYLLSESNKPSRKIPEPYVEQEIEKWNPTPNPYSPQIEELEKQKKSIIASRKKIVKYILPVAIPGGIALFLLFLGALISSLSRSFAGGLVIPGIILLVIALIFLPFLIKTGKHNKSCNQRFRSVNLQIIDLKKKSDEFEKEQKQEKADYDARVEKQKDENIRRKEEYEAAIRQQNSNRQIKPKKQTKKQTKLTKEELVEMIRSKLGKDPEELEKSNNGIKLLDYYYKRYGDTDHISDLRSLLFETPYLYFDYLNDETPWYSPNYVKEFDYNLKEKKPTPFWQPKKNLDSEYRKRCIEYFLDYKNNIDNDSDVEKEYKAMLDHMIANVVYARNGSIEEKDLSTLNKITGFEIAIDDIGTPKKQEKTSTKKEQPLKDGDIYVDYLYCDEDSRARVIKIIYRVAVNEKHKIQADIDDLRNEAAYAFSSDFDSFETYRFEDDPNILYDELIDARTLGDISAHLYNLEFDDFELEDLDKLSSEEYDQLYKQVYFKVN